MRALVHSPNVDTLKQPTMKRGVLPWARVLIPSGRPQLRRFVWALRGYNFATITPRRWRSKMQAVNQWNELADNVADAAEDIAKKADRSKIARKVRDTSEHVEHAVGAHRSANAV